jgi:hypothetical protein
LFSPKGEYGKVEWEDILGVTDVGSRRKPERRSEDNRYKISKANSDLEKLVEGPEIKPTGLFSFLSNSKISDIKETGRFLGQGATGAVHEVVLKGKKCAMKVFCFLCGKLISSSKFLEICEEINLLLKILNRK